MKIRHGGGDVGERKGRTWRNEGEGVLATIAGCAGRAPRCEGRRNETTWAIRARRQRAREGLEREEGEGCGHEQDKERGE